MPVYGELAASATVQRDIILAFADLAIYLCARSLIRTSTLFSCHYMANSVQESCELSFDPTVWQSSLKMRRALVVRPACEHSSHDLALWLCGARRSHIDLCLLCSVSNIIPMIIQFGCFLSQAFQISDNRTTASQFSVIPGDSKSVPHFVTI